MCSIITLRTEPGELSRHFRGLYDPEGIDEKGVHLRAHGFLKKELSPVIFADAHGRLTLRKKFFSLCPDWSKTWPFNFETYNARLSRPKRMQNTKTKKETYVHDELGVVVEEEIFNVPSFRSAFVRGQACLVPLSGAIESCYFGESAGKIVSFSDKNQPVFFVAGLWNDWFDMQTGEFVPTFTLLTDSPDPQIFAHGHDRGIIVLEQSARETWLKDQMSPEARLRFLREKRAQLQWKVDVERELKVGWEKRAPKVAEINAIRVWKP